MSFFGTKIFRNYPKILFQKFLSDYIQLDPETNLNRKWALNGFYVLADRAPWKTPAAKTPNGENENEENRTS